MTKKMAIIGYGARGGVYKAFADKNPELFEVVAAVEVNAERRRQLIESGVPFVYDDYREFLKANHSLDLVVISTSDSLHKEQAVACLKQGYHLLLEKPIATTRADCQEIVKAATKNDRKVFVAHVLRYTPFYRKLKEIIRSGELGEIQAIHASENVGFFHYANSYVRGNWHKESDSSPIILAKCCHDLDIIVYLMDAVCIAVSSVGGLSHFRKENAPKGSTEYCSDCPLGERCVYNAQRGYTSSLGRGFSGYFDPYDSTDEQKLELLKKTDYDRCVYHSDNDVADHQSTLMLFENGKTAVHTMSAFSKDCYRDIKIYGTKAELVANMDDGNIEIRPFGGEKKTVSAVPPKGLVGGHGGGDHFFMQQIYNALNDQPCEGITYLEVSVQSHIMAFAAEESRKRQGQLQKMK